MSFSQVDAVQVSSGNDRVMDVGAGGGIYSREFKLPSTLRPGKYDVAWRI